ARAKALGVFALGVVAMARLSGAAVGGYLTEWYSWRAIFYLNVPMALSALALLVFAVPDLKNRLHESARRLDALGMVLLMGWVASLQIALSRGERDDWFSDPFIVSLAVAFVLCLSLFIVWELRETNTAPIISLRTFQNRTFVLGATYVVI